ncbi:MAG: hypothetical protein AB4038_02430 [Prochloraceae cyanobacterium]
MSTREIKSVPLKQFPYSICPKRLGIVLLEADLVSVAQIEVALHDQVHSPDLRLGEILAIRGWIKQETADFFAQDWPDLIKQKSRKRLGWYLQQAALLKKEDINKILEEQRVTGIRFGTVAVLQGFLKSTTLDFFLMYLFPKEFKVSPCQNLSGLKGKRQLPSKSSNLELFDHHTD